MLDTSTLYLVLAMFGFVFIAVIMIHQHNCSDEVSRKRNEVESITQQYAKKTEVLEQEVVDLKTKVEELDEKIDNFEATS